MDDDRHAHDEAAAKVGRSTARIRQMAHVLGRKRAGRWEIDPARLDRWAQGIAPTLPTQKDLGNLLIRTGVAIESNNPDRSRLFILVCAEVFAWARAANAGISYGPPWG